MPTRPPSPCTQPGCPALVEKGGKCPQHRRQYERRRGSTTARGYTWDWRTKHRPRALAREPLCRFCLAEDVVKPAEQVDHIDGNPRNNDPSNLRSLCAPCHSRRTIRDQGPNAAR